MEPIQIISQDLFDKIRSRFQNLELGDETGAVTLDPREARFFDFDFVREGIDLGRISISVNDSGSLKVFYSQGITEGKDDVTKKIWFDFLKEMRYFAMRRLLRFDTRDVSKKNLDKNDFQFLAKKQSPKEEQMNTMFESRWNGKVSSKTSRRTQGRTQIIVKHKNKINEMSPLDRSKPSNILAVFIQNAEGERFKLPFNFLPLAFALAQHVEHGGLPYDGAGKKIIGMCEEIAKLQAFRKQVRSSTLNDDALQITERAIGQLKTLKAQLESLGKRRNYEAWIAEFTEDDSEIMSTELDDVTLETYKSKFTETNFKEELTQYFPILHKLMQEKVDIQQYVNDAQVTETDDQEELVKENEFTKFEKWVESIDEAEFRPDVMKRDMEEMGYLSNTPMELDNALEFFQSYGLENDPDYADLEEKLEAAKEFPAEFDNNGMEVFKLWAVENNKQDLLDELGIAVDEEPGTAQEPQPSDAAPTAPAPAAPTQTQPPVAESGNKIKHTFDETINEIVGQHFNLDNENAHPFISDEKILIEIRKAIKEKLEELGVNDESKLERAQQYAENLAKLRIQECTKMWEEKHQKSVESFNPQTQDENVLERMKELIGNIKEKVQYQEEGMMDKVKSFGKKVLDKVAPDDATLLKNLEKDSGGSIPPRFEPKPEPKNEMAEILKLSGIKN
jgi:hypothetical protein